MLQSPRKIIYSNNYKKFDFWIQLLHLLNNKLYLMSQLYLSTKNYFI